jgi:hypothetical protein
VARAAAELGHTDIPSSVSFWLDLPRRDGTGFETGTMHDGLATVEFGKLSYLCDLSADLCLKLETEEVSKDFAPDVRDLTRQYLIDARSKLVAIREALKAGDCTVGRAAEELEVAARVWGQNLHAALLEKAAQNGLPREEFERRASAQAREIVTLAVEYFSIFRAGETTGGATPLMIGDVAAVVRGENAP